MTKLLVTAHQREKPLESVASKNEDSFTEGAVWKHRSPTGEITIFDEMEITCMPIGSTFLLTSRTAADSFEAR